MSKSGGVFQIDDVTRTMSKGGVRLVFHPSKFRPPPHLAGWLRACITITCAYNVAVCFGPRRMLNVGHGGVKYIVVVKGGPYYIHGV